jgi:hypothetical protein
VTHGKRWTMRARFLHGLVGAGLCAGACAVVGCSHYYEDEYLSLIGTGPGGDGGTDGGDSGPPPSCIPSLNSTPVDKSCGVFVSSESGNDATGTGTPMNPYKTITTALANGSTIYACAGTLPYAEALSVNKRVTLFGALDCGTWAYVAAKPTQLTAASDMVPLTFSSSAGGSDVEDFAIMAADAMKDGGSSIGVIADGITASFARLDITAGNGKEGLNGTTPTASVGPTDPTDPTIVGIAGSNACMATSVQLGGAPVDNPICGSTGGKGGDGSVSSGSSGDLQPTASAQTALGGAGQPNTDPGNIWSCLAGSGLGAGGTTGGNGAPGTGAKSTDLGTLDATVGYTGVAGQSGGPGTPGQGGGGGGGAKGKSSCAGASGGSGGAGGCGGNGGGGGNPGGASIGIVSLGATLTFDAVTIAVGTGGKGGDGGPGQVGGVGGNGGQGGLGNNAGQNLSSACSGGGGGPGGTGGTGGGGRGGHAIGIAYTGTTAPSTMGVSFSNTGTVGMGGAGDDSMGNMGDGVAGIAATTQGF